MATRLEQRMNDLIADESGNRLLRLNITQAEKEKLIIFSDLHRGLADSSDDFKNNNQASYNKALQYYLDHDFGLVHLGDIEELKENWSVSKVLDKHKIHLSKEAEFHQKNKYFRVFGNHDSQYEKTNTVRSYLHPYFKDLKVYEGILLQFGMFPDILMVHGHQGYLPIVTNLFEYIGLPVYRWIVNDIIGKPRKVNYESYCAIEKDENAFYAWCEKQYNTILIFGHTHRPLWGSKTVVDNYKLKLESKVRDLKDVAQKNNVTVNTLKLNPVQYGVEMLIQEINEYISVIQKKMEEHGTCSAPKTMPLIFNTGCSIFHDGDITGIEIDQGNIRLIKWGVNKTKTAIEREVLEEEYLGDMILG